MASNGSRKRRHKSKERIRAVSKSGDLANQEVQQSQQKHKKQQEKQQHPHLQQQQLLENAETSRFIAQPLLACILDRLFLPRPPDMATFEPRDDGTGVIYALTQDEHAVKITCMTTDTSTGNTDGVTKSLDDPANCFTTLLSATTWKNHEVVEALLQKGADVGEVSEIGQNSLMIAAHNCDVTMMDLLWTNRGLSFDINARDKDGNTALHHCTLSGCKEGFSFLLDRGADCRQMNNEGKCPLHIAASQGNVAICGLIVKHIIPDSDGQSSRAREIILCEDMEEKTPICEAAINQHLNIVDLLLDACTSQETVEFYTRNMRKLSSLPSNDPSMDVEPILAPLLVVVIRLQKDCLREMAEIEPMQHLVQAIQHCSTSARVLSTTCMIMSVLTWDDSAKEGSTSKDMHSQKMETNEGPDIKEVLVQQFLDCRGPDVVMEKLSIHILTVHDAYLIISTLLPVMILASRASGRVWLEQNSSNLSFYKELLKRHKAFVTHSSFGSQSGLDVGHIIKTFLRFVEETEAKDREQNLALLLEEEERDRLKRERKKRKRQKKQSRQTKTETQAATDADVSTDDESGECATWNTVRCRSSEIFSHLEDMSGEKDPSHLYFQTKHHRQPPSDDQYNLVHSQSHATSMSNKTFSSEACSVSEKFLEREPRWRHTSIPEEFPPVTSDERGNSDASDGWVKVESRKQNLKSSCRHSPVPIILRPIKQLDSRQAPMRWADVARLGYSRDTVTRNFTVLLGNGGRCTTSEYYKMSLLRNSANQSTTELGDSRSNVEGEGEDWQQIARNAYADNMTSKQTDDEQGLAVNSSSSDSDSEALSSTLSSECPSGQSDRVQNRKKMLVVDDFDHPDTNTAKDLMSEKSNFSFREAFSDFLDDPRDVKSVIFDDKSSRIFGDVGKRTLSTRPFFDENPLSTRDKISNTAWNRSEKKSSIEFSGPWKLSSLPKSQDIVEITSNPSERVRALACAESNDEDLNLTSFSRSKTPPNRTCSDGVDDSMINICFPTLYCPNTYYDIHQGTTVFRQGLDISNKSRPAFTVSFQKGQETFNDSSSQWNPDKRPAVSCNLEQNSWLNKDVKRMDGSNCYGWNDAMNIDNISISHQHAVNCFMPSFTSMASAVDNNPIVTSVVESVLAPNVISLSSLTLPNKPPTYSSKLTEFSSPPPGFKFPKQNQIRLSNFDHTISMLNSQATMVNKATPALSSQGITMQTPANFSNGENINYDTLRQVDKQFMLGTLGSRSPMIGVVGPFSKGIASNEDTLILQQSQQQILQHQRQQPYFQSVSGTIFNQSVTGSSIVPGSDTRAQGGGSQSVYELPLDNWTDRFHPLSLPTPVTSSAMSHSQFSWGTAGSSDGDFSAILSGRLQQKRSLKHQDIQNSQLKRLPQQYQDIQLKSFHEAVENCQRRYSEQALAQQQQQQRQQFYSQSLQQNFRASLKQNKASMNCVQQKQSLGVHQYQTRGQQQLRLPSPPVLFPSDLRDEPESSSRPGDKPGSPPFHDLNDGDLLSDLFDDPLLVERIAINQIRQQVLASYASNMMRDTAMSALRDSVYCNDLEYYASLYHVKLKDLLPGPPQTEVGNSEAAQVDRACGLSSRSDLDKTGLTCLRSHSTMEGRCLPSERDTEGERCSRRWREALNKILDTAWTMRRQFGDIVLPNSLSDYNISQVEYPLVLGFTTDGCAVAVLILEKSQAYIDPYLLDIMCDPELDHHFILKCKGMSETRTNEYVALDLCDYTLAEYMQIVQLSHHQDPLSANRLAWQLLEGLKFIHHNLSMPHGNLKPSWIFVDSEGRLRLAGYGIVTKQSGASLLDVKSGPDKSEMDRAVCWTATEDLHNDNAQPSMSSDIQVAGMLLYFILTGGQHPFGATPLEAEVNIARNTTHMDLISDEANDLVSGMLFPDPGARPTVEHCLKHPFFWSCEKKFRLILIVGSDVLTEMKTGIALTGNGSPTMTEILSVLDICDVSPNWVQTINPTVMKEMRSFRVYKNSLSELTLFIYNCCLHFDKMSSVAKEVLDDPCKYFQMLFPSLFMAIYRSLKASDRTDRTCYKPFFY